MSDQPLISVLMGVRDAPEKYLREAILSILGQTYKNLEFVIVDDSANDIAPTIIAEYAKKDGRVVYVRGSGTTLAAALNNGINICKGEFIARMDSDDISAPERLEKQLKYLLDKKLDMCGAGIQIIDSDGNIKSQRLCSLSHDEIVKSLIYIQPVPHPTWFLKKEVYEKFKYNERYLVTEDKELLIRILNVFKAGNVPEYLLKYRVHSGAATISNMSATNWAAMKLSLKLIFKYRTHSILDLKYLIRPFISSFVPAAIKKFIYKIK